MQVAAQPFSGFFLAVFQFGGSKIVANVSKVNRQIFKKKVAEAAEGGALSAYLS